jgi:acyl carrier protein
MNCQLTRTIHELISIHGRLTQANTGALDDHTNLYEAGMSSHASLNLMLALEAEFTIEFPDHLLRRSTFENIASIRNAIQGLQSTARSPSIQHQIEIT